MGDKTQDQRLGGRPGEGTREDSPGPSIKVSQVGGQRPQGVGAHARAGEVGEGGDIVIVRSSAKRSRRSIGRIAARVSSSSARRTSGSEVTRLPPSTVSLSRNHDWGRSGSLLNSGRPSLVRPGDRVATTRDGPQGRGLPSSRGIGARPSASGGLQEPLGTLSAGRLPSDR